MVRIGRPEKRNAVDSATAARLHDEFVAFEASDEALAIGLVSRVVPAGAALDAAVALAGEIAAFPWTCVVSDRRAVYEGLGQPLDDGLELEDRLGRETIFAPGFAEGVERFLRR